MYSHRSVMHYICLFSHVVLQESLMPCQYSPHMYVHSGNRTESKVITPNISYLKALCLVGGCGCTDKSCGAPASLEQFLAPHCNSAPSQGAFWGLSNGEANYVKILRTCIKEVSRIEVGLFKTPIKFLVPVMARSHKKGKKGENQFFLQLRGLSM